MVVITGYTIKFYS